MDMEWVDIRNILDDLSRPMVVIGWDSLCWYSYSIQSFVLIVCDGRVSCFYMMDSCLT